MVEKVKKIWEWVKAMVAKLFRQSKPTQVQMKCAESPKAIVPMRWRHNMPKYQPCPNGHGWKKRREKTMRGANYWCNRCLGNFFVSA